MIPQSALSTSTSHRLYALVNTTSDAPTQLATLHTPDELAFFKRLLDALFETRNGPERELLALKSTDALNLARADPSSTALPSTQSAATQTAAAQSSLTQKDAEKALQSFLDEGWLEKSERGYYTLSCRALLELREYLKATYDGEGPLAEGELPRIKECWACKEMLTVGQRCADLACACRLHDRCVETFFRTGPGREKKCPVCRREWTQDCFVGERAATGAGGGTGTGAGNGNGTGTGRERRSGAGGRRSTAGVGRG